MYYVSGIWRRMSDFYSEMNPATLTGAIDVVVVEQPDGTLRSSPFHVRFGKYGVLQSREKVVDIEINDAPVDIRMKLGANGEAFFVEGVEDDDADIPLQLATSPLPRAATTERLISGGLERLRALSDSESDDDAPSNVRAAVERQSRVPSRRSMPNLAQPSHSAGGWQRRPRAGDAVQFGIDDDDKTPTVESLRLPLHRLRTADADRSVFSDGECTPVSSRSPSPGPVSDSEVERRSRDEKRRATACDESVTEWKWGELPDSTPTDECKPVASAARPSAAMPRDSARLSSDARQSGWSFFGWSRGSSKQPTEGVYLDDLAAEDPNLRSRYLNYLDRTASDSDSPRRVDECVAAGDADERPPPAESVDAAAIEAAEQPVDGPPVSPPHSADVGYGSGPSSVVAVGGRASPWPLEPAGRFNYEAAAMSLCGDVESDLSSITVEQFNSALVTFEQFCADPVAILDSPNLVFRCDNRLLRRPAAEAWIIANNCFQSALPSECLRRIDGEVRESERARHSSGSSTSARGGWFTWRRGGSAEPSDADRDAPIVSSAAVDVPTPLAAEDHSRQTDAFEARRFKRALRLSSGKLRALKLRPGANQARFSVTTKFQGTSWCTCRIYLWRSSDSIIVSDIDGTITKSDVLGHIVPAMGGTWAHGGVARLYSRIALNGYKFVYLSARAIGQSHQTKAYLSGIAQDSEMLPDGPLLLSPVSLLSALHKEVIEKKPEEFKMAALSDVSALFPDGSQPLYAGFGNRVNDVTAYRQAGIPMDRILTVNPYGEVRSASGFGYRSSYTTMVTSIVDFVFPPRPLADATDYSALRVHSARYVTVDIDDDAVQQYSQSRTATAAALNGKAHKQKN